MFVAPVGVSHFPACFLSCSLSYLLTFSPTLPFPSPYAHKALHYGCPRYQADAHKALYYGCPAPFRLTNHGSLWWKPRDIPK